MTKMMSVGFSLFNLHVNDAGTRARMAMTAMGPQGVKMLEEIDRLEEEGNGIMYLLEVEPTPAITAFVSLVFSFVNEQELRKPLSDVAQAKAALEAAKMVPVEKAVANLVAFRTKLVADGEQVDFPEALRRFVDQALAA